MIPALGGLGSLLVLPRIALLAAQEEAAIVSARAWLALWHRARGAR